MWVDKGNSWWKAEENILIKHLSVLLGFGDFFSLFFLWLWSLWFSVVLLGFFKEGMQMAL